MSKDRPTDAQVEAVVDKLMGQSWTRVEPSRYYLRRHRLQTIVRAAWPHIAREIRNST